MSIAPPLTITNARLMLPGAAEPVAGALRCADGHIAAVGPDVAPEAGDAIHDAGGKLVTPGLVDFGAFAVDKPAFHFGGIVRAALMPDNRMLDVPSRVRFVASSGKPDFWVHPLAAATLRSGSASHSWSRVKMLRESSKLA